MFKTANNDSISRPNSRPKLPFPGNGKGKSKMPREGKGREIWGLYSWESWETGIPAHPWAEELYIFVEKKKMQNNVCHMWQDLIWNKLEQQHGLVWIDKPNQRNDLFQQLWLRFKHSAHSRFLWVRIRGRPARWSPGNGASQGPSPTTFVPTGMEVVTMMIRLMRSKMVMIGISLKIVLEQTE